MITLHHLGDLHSVPMSNTMATALQAFAKTCGNWWVGQRFSKLSVRQYNTAGKLALR